MKLSERIRSHGINARLTYDTISLWKCLALQLEEQVDWHKDANRKWQIKWEQLEAENEEKLELLEEAKYLILKLSIKAQQVSMWETILGRIDAQHTQQEDCVHRNTLEHLPYCPDCGEKC